jgi:hypothetical protein
MSSSQSQRVRGSVDGGVLIGSQGGEDGIRESAA